LSALLHRATIIPQVGEVADKQQTSWLRARQVANKLRGSYGFVGNKLATSRPWNWCDV